MLRIKYILIVVLLLSVTAANAQRTYREHMRKGNNLYMDSVYDKADVEYRKALELDLNSAETLYNLGNTLLFQNKAEDAMSHYQMAAERETDKRRLAEIHHNMGVIYQSSKDYAKAVELYKQSLRENPHDNMTRYNLALAMSLLKNQQNQQQNQEQQQEEQQQQEQEQQQQEQQNQQQEQQEQQEQQPESQEQQEQEMSKENAEQLLESAMQDEKEVQEKVKKMMQLKGRKLDKDW